MRPPTRVWVPTLMILVALVALAFGVPVEWMNHRRRDECLRAAARDMERAARHMGQAAGCARSQGGAPYPQASRLAEIDEHLGAGYSKGAGLDGTLTDWSRESDWHQYWGQRIHDQALVALKNARTFESRLLIP